MKTADERVLRLQNLVEKQQRYIESLEHEVRSARALFCAGIIDKRPQPPVFRSSSKRLADEATRLQFEAAADAFAEFERSFTLDDESSDGNEAGEAQTVHRRLEDERPDAGVEHGSSSPAGLPAGLALEKGERDVVLALSALPALVPVAPGASDAAARLLADLDAAAVRARLARAKARKLRQKLEREPEGREDGPGAIVGACTGENRGRGAGRGGGKEQDRDQADQSQSQGRQGQSPGQGTNNAGVATVATDTGWM
eukprot:g5887.t1